MRSYNRVVFLILISALMILWSFLWPTGNKLVLGMAYVDIADGTEIKAYKEYNYEGFAEENSNKQHVNEGTAYFNLKWNHEDLTGIMIKPTDGADSCLLNFMNIYITHNRGDIPVCQLDSSSIMDAFEITDGDWSIDEAGFLRITPESEDCALVCTSSDLIESIKNIDSTLASRNKVGRIGTVIVILGLLWLAVINADRIMAFFEKQDLWSLISILAIVVVGTCVWVIAFHSTSGHPDEDDVIKCLNYGMNHIVPPDMRIDDIADTYSGYGYTKLSNSTWYYLIAGKLAWIANKLWTGILYYRVPNFLMFVVMAYIYIKQVQKQRWLSLILGICVQAWYIFSYTTADAMDFFLCFITLVLVTDGDSLLFKSVDEKFEFKGIWRHALLGILFGFIFLGKPNYWAILGIVFVALLFKLFEKSREDRKSLWINYGVILGFFALTAIFRYSFDLYHYGFGISQVKAEMEALHSAYDKNPTTPSQDIAVTYRMFRYGHSLPELFMAAPTWFKSTFRSFFGVLSDTTSKDTYFNLMGVLYGFLLFVLAYFGVKNVSEKPKNDKIRMFLLFGLFVLSFVASIINSYVSDSQPQGRYLLPMLFTASYIAYLTPEIFEKKYFKMTLVSLQILSTWYFVTAGVGCFV